MRFISSDIFDFITANIYRFSFLRFSLKVTIDSQLTYSWLTEFTKNIYILKIRLFHVYFSLFLQQNFPYALCFHAADVCNHDLFVFGGTNTSGERVNHLHKLQLGLKSLRRLAWLEVSKRLQANKCLDWETLRKLGIPRCFDEWLDGPIMLAGWICVSFMVVWTTVCFISQNILTFKLL